MGPGGGHGGGGAGGWKYLAYGAVSGATARTIVAPLERFKILLEEWNVCVIRTQQPNTPFGTDSTLF